MKNKTEIKIDNSKIINVFAKDSLNSETLNQIKDGAMKTFVFFDKIRKIEFSIEFIYSRDEFDKKLNKKTENWMVANSFLNNRFIIFSPDEIEKYTTHKKSEFLQIVAHETCHILLKSINDNFSFWINEGLATNIAGQIKTNKVTNENIDLFFKYGLFKNSNYKEFTSHQGYTISYKIMKYLLDNYDKKTIINLMKIKYDSENSCEDLFCRILNIQKNKLIDLFKEILEN